MLDGQPGRQIAELASRIHSSICPVVRIIAGLIAGQLNHISQPSQQLDVAKDLSVGFPGGTW